MEQEITMRSLMEKITKETGALDTAPEFRAINNSKTIFDNAIHLIYGERNSGKSYFVFNTLLAFLEESDEVDKKDVLYFDGDGTGATFSLFKNRIKNNKDRFYYRYIMGYNELPKLLVKTNITNAIIVLDSVKDFFLGLNMDSNQEVIKFYNVIKKLLKLNNTIILIAHATKLRGTKGETLKIKIQGNENAFESSAHFIYQARADKTITVTKSRSNELTENKIIQDKTTPSYQSLDGLRLEEVKQKLGVYNDPDIKEQFYKDENILWETERIGRKKIFKAI